MLKIYKEGRGYNYLIIENSDEKIINVFFVSFENNCECLTCENNIDIYFEKNNYDFLKFCFLVVDNKRIYVCFDKFIEIKKIEANKIVFYYDYQGAEICIFNEDCPIYWGFFQKEEKRIANEYHIDFVINSVCCNESTNFICKSGNNIIVLQENGNI